MHIATLLPTHPPPANFSPPLLPRIASFPVFGNRFCGIWLESIEAAASMGHEHDAAAPDSPQVEILERGDIFFFYRPKVDKEDPESLDDVQRMYIVLRPQSGERVQEEKQSSEARTREVNLKEKSEGEGKAGQNKRKHNSPVKDSTVGGNQMTEPNSSVEGGKGSEKVNIEERPLLRFILMGRKYLPDPKQRKRPFWGYVELVTTNVDDIKKLLSGEEYDTATRGHRHKPAARPVGEGLYRIVRHGGQRHTHLVYRLELPPEVNEGGPQDADQEPRATSSTACRTSQQTASHLPSKFARPYWFISICLC